MNFPILKEVIEKNLYQFAKADVDFFSAIKKAFYPLLKNGYANDAYLKDITNSVLEYGPYFVFYDFLAIAHGAFSENVYKSGISICFFDKGIKYQNSQARIFLVLASKKTKKHEEIITELTNILSDEKYLNQFKAIQTPEDFFSFVNLRCDKNM